MGRRLEREWIRVAWIAWVCALAPVPAGAELLAYVSNEDAGTVSMVALARAEVVAEVVVGKRPRGIQVSPDGRRVYVALSGAPKCPPTLPDADCAALERDRSSDGIGVVDVAARKLVRTLAVGSDPEQFDLAGDERHLVVTNEDAATLSLVDVARGTVVRSFAVGREPEGVRLLPNQSVALVTNESDHSLAVVDLSGRSPVRFVAVGQRPRDVLPLGGGAYVSNEGDGTVRRVRLGDGRPLASVSLGPDARPMGLAYDARRERIYATTGRAGRLAIIDARVDRLEREVQIGGRLWGIALTPQGDLACIANGPASELACVDTRSDTVSVRIAVGAMPWGVAIAEEPTSDRAGSR